MKMTHLSLVVAAFLPYLWFWVATALRLREFGKIDNQHPRIQQAKQTGAGARAVAAQANAFEALAVWAPAVLAARATNPASPLAPTLAVAWMVFRVLHGVAYVAGIARVRTLLFLLSLGCAIRMYMVAGRGL
jgi:uncharacterized MAPEG superfamily protein